MAKEQIGRHCPFCGAIIVYDEYFCRACHKRLLDQQDFDAPSTVKPETYVVAGRRVWLTAILAIICPGLGQFYNGDTLKGLAFFTGFILVSFGIVGSEYRTLLFFGIWVAAIIDAVYSSWSINRVQRNFTGTSYFLYALIFIFAAIVALHVYTGEPDMTYLAKLFPAVRIWIG
jgi:TM2 domain-containing membrane protein YozV